MKIKPIASLVGQTIAEVLEVSPYGQAMITMEDGTVFIARSVLILTGDAHDHGTKPKAEAPAKEVAKPAAKPAPEPVKEKKMTFVDLENMDEEELFDLIDDEDLDIKTKGLDEGELRLAIAKAMKIEIPEDVTEEDEDDDDEDEKPAPKAAVKNPDITWKDLVECDYDDLCEVIKDYKIKGVDPDDYDDDTIKGFRKAIAKKLEIEIPAK